MNCHDAQSLMHGYLDRELDLAGSLQCEQHVRECPACARMLAEQRTMQAELKADALYYRAPDTLRDRLRSTLKKQGGARVARFPWRSLAAAACLLLFLGTGFLLGQLAFAPSARERLTQQVAFSHIRSLQVEHLVDVPSSDRHTVKPWFNGKLDFSPPTPDLSKHDFTLVGGRLDYLNGRAVAAVVYSRRAHYINLFVWPESGNEETEIRREARQGYHLMHWSRDGMQYWIVSDLDPAQMNELAERLRE